VEEYGDLDVGSMHVSDFLGYQISRNSNSFTAKLPSVAVSRWTLIQIKGLYYYFLIVNVIFIFHLEFFL
jgi:hypothetical protein